MFERWNTGRAVRAVVLCLLVVAGGCSAQRKADDASRGSAGSPLLVTAGRSSTAGRTGSATSMAGNTSTPGAPGADAPCKTVGATRSCCGTGTQTCEGSVEFVSWGACVDGKGKPLSCTATCAEDEFGRCKDAGVPDAGSRCGEGEFSPACDMPMLCHDKTVNNEPEILAAFAPAIGESVGQDGEIKVWITDEWAPFVAPGEMIDASTGLITAAGDRSVKGKDGYLVEPALYIAPDTVEKSGHPYFPQYIRGWYNNMPPAAGVKPVKNSGTLGAAIEPAPAAARMMEKYNSQYVWKVSELGLAPGVYLAEFMIADGDHDRGVGCVTIKID